VNRSIVVALADSHAGHGLGLLNPATILVRADEDGNDEQWCPEPTENQRRLWHLYQQNIEQVTDLAAGDDLVVFHDGDLTNGEKYPDGLIPGVSLADQRDIGYYNLLPWASVPNLRVMRIITGTLSHVPDAAEARVARELREKTGLDVKAEHHTRCRARGVLFDVAHHGPQGGSRDWLRGNVARYYLRDRIYRDRRLGVEPARVYIRAHYHIWCPETVHERWAGKQQRHDLTVLPSMSGITQFARQRSGSEPVLMNGLICYEIRDGRLFDIHALVEEYDTRQEEVIL
jgi:8-oxo-dGTP pyrophosphatase MutT (NUDIX family)